MPSILSAQAVTFPYYSPKLREKFHLIISKTLPSHQQEFASIGFHPNLEEFRQRSACLRSQRSNRSLPSGWPTKVEGAMAWAQHNAPNEEDFVLHLSNSDKDEIHKALRYHQALGLEMDETNRGSFPLPQLSKMLSNVQEEVYNGIGYHVLRGLDIDRYSAEELSIIFCGISSYIADKRGKQDQEGSMIRHIVDFDRDEAQKDLPFHTDVVCDVVATLTRDCADHGGKGTLASGLAVYNDLAARRPDVVRILAEPNWPLDTYGRSPAYYHRALLFNAGGKILFNFSRRILTGHTLSPRTEGIPGLTEQQAEALDALHFSARDHQITLSMQRGDIRFVNNMGLLHGREAFEDAGGSTKTSRRHIVRLWLHDSQTMRILPPALQLAWQRTFHDDTRSLRWDFDPLRSPDGHPLGIQLSQCD